ncbi:hypothetical protein PR048_027858 [Dryococelus australis]|uniref:DUF4371 domain-containing protein n=1 Tax=Dryococelus australis TaxID=614101 RepID=A0ABQ9GHP2_9NEOP|nr:hypothetical protein PR048_027858 [Dryococelus australis]
MNIPLSDMRGQGYSRITGLYNKRTNMKGKHSDLQRRILDMNKRAFYTPCSSHSINLVLNDAAMSSQYTNNFLSLTLKPLSDARCESRIEALNPPRYQIGQVYDVLADIGENFDYGCLCGKFLGQSNKGLHIPQFPCYLVRCTAPY